MHCELMYTSCNWMNGLIPILYTVVDSLWDMLWLWNVLTGIVPIFPLSFCTKWSIIWWHSATSFCTIFRCFMRNSLPLRIRGDAALVPNPKFLFFVRTNPFCNYFHIDSWIGLVILIHCRRNLIWNDGLVFGTLFCPICTVSWIYPPFSIAFYNLYKEQLITLFSMDKEGKYHHINNVLFSMVKITRRWKNFEGGRVHSII